MKRRIVYRQGSGFYWPMTGKFAHIIVGPFATLGEAYRGEYKWNTVTSALPHYARWRDHAWGPEMPFAVVLTQDKPKPKPSLWAALMALATGDRAALRRMGH